MLESDFEMEIITFAECRVEHVLELEPIDFLVLAGGLAKDLHCWTLVGRLGAYLETRANHHEISSAVHVNWL